MDCGGLRWIAVGLRLDCGWIAVGLRLDCGWIAVGLRLDCGWIAVGLRLDCGWIAVGLRLDCGGLRLDCGWIAVGLRLDCGGLRLDCGGLRWIAVISRTPYCQDTTSNGCSYIHTCTCSISVGMIKNINVSDISFLRLYFMTNITNIFTFILYNDYDTPGKHYNSLLISLESFGQYNTLTDTLAFKDHWPHDLQDFSGKTFNYYYDNNF